ncbi:MAG: aminotransferase class I/II-fold pyridoxal phosphate-dependent enzyme [Ilumatobacteraceae bacterium]
MTTEGFVPPPYPYDRLDALKELAAVHDGGVVDLSIGDPCDPPAAEVVGALSTSNSERSYPASIGIEPLRAAARSWFQRKFDIDIPISQIAACVGSKEFVVTTPQWLKLRTPSRDTVLYPAVSYPSYAMGATLSGCRGVPVPMNSSGGLNLSAISDDDARRALMIWMNTPSNPTGALDDIDGVVAWGRRHEVPVFSDECYVEFTWQGKACTALQHGTQGVVSVHSLSKRSNLAGLRVGFYAGDADLVNYLKDIRKHVGMMVPGPAQAAGVVALNDDASVVQQAERYKRRLLRCAELLSKWSGCRIEQPAGGFYLWFDTGDGWAFAERLARQGGALVSPGDFYGAGGANNVRVAVVQPDDRIELVAKRLGLA